MEESREECSALKAQPVGNLIDRKIGMSQKYLRPKHTVGVEPVHIQKNILQMEIDKETKLGSRLITAVFIFTITIVPFFFGDKVVMFPVAMCSLAVLP